MNDKLQISLCMCIGNETQLKRFFRGNTYKYFVINAKKIYDSSAIEPLSKPLYFVKDPWYNDSYIMLSECMFDKMFAKLHGVNDKTNELFYNFDNKTNELSDIFEVKLPEDSPQIVAENKDVSNDHSFIEINKYR